MTRIALTFQERLERLEAVAGKLQAELRQHAIAFAALEVTRKRDVRSAVGAVKRPSIAGEKMSVICEAVAQAYGVTAADLKGPSRSHTISMARQEAMRLMSEAGHSQPKIGRFLGGRDPSTIWHGIHAARARLDVARQK